MRNEYDFSKGERGKFHHPDIELNLPVYLDPDVEELMQELAEKKGLDIDKIVNDWLRKSMDTEQNVE